MTYSAKDVSIIIPIYCKDEQDVNWLIECLDSAISQGSEVVAYDDGSPVDVEPILSKYTIVTGYGLINKGVSIARNKAVELATRELILPLDCDDTLKSGAVEILAKMWKGTPVYPDVSKFGDENESHYALLEFDCKHLTDMVGFCSVNVLHSKAQWESLGGWNDKLDYFEDGEYNARLMGTYCATHCPRPLVNYRIHKGQRTQTYEKRNREYAVKILQKVRKYDMPCPSCGGVRRTKSNMVSNNQPTKLASPTGAPSPTVNIMDVNLPTELEGKVLAKYVGGKGRGTHYYNGPVSKIPYRVNYGQYLYVDVRDTKDDENDPRPWFLVRVRATSPAPQAQEAVQPVVRKAVQAPQRQPAIGEELAADMNVATLKDLEDEELTPDQAQRLLDIEKAGKNRPKVIKFLESKLK